MFWPQMLAIFRLYNENLSIYCTCMCREFIGCREGGRCTCEISPCVCVCVLGEGGGALDMGCLGTIYRQRTVPTYKYV